MIRKVMVFWWFKEGIEVAQVAQIRWALDGKIGNDT